MAPSRCSNKIATSSSISGAEPFLNIPIVAIEAIIGAGKSTLLEAIKQHFGGEVVVVPEPVRVWTDVEGHNLLEEYYKNQQRWAFSFQTFAICSRVAAVKEALSKVVPGVTKALVMERSWFSDRECFASLLHDSGAMNPLEEAMHKQMFEWGLESGGWPHVDGFIYLDVDIDIAQGRVAKRGRSEESSIPSDYQLKLHAKHQHWVRALEEKKQRQATAVDQADASPTSVDQACAMPFKTEATPGVPPAAAATAAASAKALARAALARGSQAPASEASVLRLDCSVENSEVVVRQWLRKIRHFVASIAKEKEQCAAAAAAAAGPEDYHTPRGAIPASRR